MTVTTATTYLLLPIMVIGYFSFCVIYNLIKTSKRWKDILYKIKTCNIPARWLGISVFLVLFMFIKFLIVIGCVLISYILYLKNEI